MKVLLVNGSTHKNGNTAKALSVVERVIRENGIETELLWIGNGPVRGCINCKYCAKNRRCAFDDDICNRMIEAFLEADGVIVGSPVYCAGPNGTLCALLDRLIYALAEFGRDLRGKPAAGVVTLWRGGGTAALDRLNKYFTYAGMPVVGNGTYWNLSFEEDSAMQPDDMGIRTMEELGRCMSVMVKARLQEEFAKLQ